MSDMQDDDRNLDAAEYVLGTLSPEAAQAFGRQMRQDPALARAVADWETRLGRLGEDLPAVEPPAEVWQGIADDLGISRPTGPADSRPAANDGAVKRWRLAAIAASTAAVVLAGALWFGGPAGVDSGAANTSRFASMIYDQPTGMSWLIHSARADSSELAVEALQDYAVPEGKTLRMYVRSAAGQASLVGDLPHQAGRYVMNLSSDARDMMQPDSELVVAMEDAGAAKGQVSGKIMWVTPIALRRG